MGNAGAQGAQGDQGPIGPDRAQRGRTVLGTGASSGLGTTVTNAGVVNFSPNNLVTITDFADDDHVVIIDGSDNNVPKKLLKTDLGIATSGAGVTVDLDVLPSLGLDMGVHGHHQRAGPDNVWSHQP